MKKYFMLKLNPPRSTFAQDMSDEERAIMRSHVAYWTNLMDQGHVVAFGPVMDPEGVYGLGIIGVDDKSQVDEFIKNDPATGLNQYEYYPMMAVVAGAK